MKESLKHLRFDWIEIIQRKGVTRADKESTMQCLVIVSIKVEIHLLNFKFFCYCVAQKTLKLLYFSSF